VVHFYRNVWSLVPSTKIREVSAMLKAIHASEDRAAARIKAAHVVSKLREMKLSAAAQLVETSIEEDSVRQVSHIYIGSCRSGGRLSEL
jgi:transposase-like protein